MAAGPGEHEPGAAEQRPEQLPDRDVEADTASSGARVSAAVEAIGALHPEQPVADAAVVDHDALGPPGRAGGVDDVGELKVGRRAPGTVERPARRADGRDGAPWLRPPAARRRGRPRQQHGGPGVLQHEGEPLARIVGIERQVGGARLERRQQADHQIERALQENADAGSGAAAEGGEAAGQAPGPAVELGVGQRPALEAHGGGLGRARRLPLDHLVQAEGLRVRRAVSFHSARRRSLHGGEDRGRRGIGVGVGGQGFERALVERGDRLGLVCRRARPGRAPPGGGDRRRWS